MTRKSIPESEGIYVVFNFWDATKDFTLSEQIKGWRGALDECIEVVNHEVDEYNENPYNGSKCDYIEFDEMQGYLYNDQNIIIGNHTIGILDITPHVNFEDYIILIKSDVEFSQKDIESMQMSFESETFFRGYMKRFCDVNGGVYRLIKPEQFDRDFQNLGGFNHVIHTKIAF